MYKKAISTPQEIAIHLFFWLFMAYLNLVEVDTSNGDSLVGLKAGLFHITGALVFILTFYLNYLYLSPFTFRPFTWKKVLLTVVVLYAFFILLRYLVEQELMVELFGIANYYGDFSMAYYIFDNIYYGSFPILSSTFLWSVLFVIRLLHENKLIMEEQKNTEIKFLKAQINPHFIFNTLNNIYAMVYFKSEHSLAAIDRLSQIMRFTTYESQKESIRLSEEINYIKAYIELEQLRHGEQYPVNLYAPLENCTIEIPPYILSPLVENALKHGLASKENPIEIKLEIIRDTLKFTVKNCISGNKKDKLGGVGLDNLKKRLEIYYPKAYVMRLTDRDNLFIAYLEILLK
ncbi:sensor histidine kinase YesM [Algoriphagus sp. 4150]|uniref:sensor histidine kinase n=1 Tax=Algoriphagus sp. 4150 TaxID=2817756 RepID=UPI0028570DD5|nr:histidine kinase [Algoriphagus sp. 4150]MDR7130204.1 sensor histidine kinase YesM [Algoriphagus sp. 4150]